MSKDSKIQFIAESLLDQFKPKDESQTFLSFCFTIPPSNNYEVTFNKINNEWIFKGFTKQESNE